MRYVEYAPAPDLRAWVDRYWLLEDGNPQSAPQAVLPDGHPEWVIHLAEPFAGQGACLAIGQMTGPVLLRAGGPISAFGIRFRPAGAWAFHRCDQAELTERILDLSSIAPRWREQAGNGDPVRATDAVLRSLKPVSERRVAPAADLLLSGHSVDAVAHECNWSPRQLERMVLSRTGIPPAMLRRLGRFRRAVRLRSAGLSWATVAAAAGFADQSHLIRDFRRFTGTTPAGFEASPLTEALVR